MQLPRSLVFLACYALTGTVMGAVQAEVRAESNEDHQAIRAAAKDYMAAKRRGDFAALRKMWTVDGDYVDASGQVFKAQEVISAQTAASASEVASGDVPAREGALRFITADVAIEDGTTDDGSAASGRFTAVWVKRDGRWLLDSLREASVSSPSPNDRLKPLEWLLGEWVGKTDDAVVLVSTHWSEGGNYIVREFLVRAEGRDVLTGSQRIGWDPVAGKIKSWVFDSNGGSGEGYWMCDGERWVVDTEEVMPDGKKSSASVLITPGGEGLVVWEVKSAKVGDVNLPARRIEFKRAAEDE